MRIIDAALSHRATVFFLMTAAVLLGLTAYVTLPRERFPEVQIPLVIVVVPYPGAAPAEVESQITTPLERELTGLEGLKQLSSISQEGQSLVTVEFVVGTDIDLALPKVRDRVDRAEVDFPDEAEEVLLQEINFSSFPILQVHLAGDVGPVVLKQIAEDLQDEVETVPGVLQATLAGLREREVRVDVDPERLRNYGLALDDVVEAVRDENVSIPGGSVELGDLSYAVRVPGEVEEPTRVADFVITAEAGRPVFVRDVAEVTFGFKDRDSYARINGKDSIALSVQKRAGANIIEVIDQVKAVTHEVQASWPAGMEITYLGDQSYDIRLQVKDLENSILSGLLLVALVLMVFLGLRNALFVALAIPFSMLLTFMTLELMGTSLNTVSLFALVLAVGMLVDNGVVVVENIFRHIQEGADPQTAASRATHEVGAAIAVSTYTTVGAFAPLFFWPGVIGDFMSYLPQTVSIALLASLLIGLTVNPVVCSVWMRPAAIRRRSFGDALIDKLLAGYERLLRFALAHRALIVGGTLLLFVVVFGVFAVWNHGVEFVPDTEPNQIFVDLEVPPGTRVGKTDEVVRELERRLGDLTDLDVLAASTGEGSQSSPFGGGADINIGRLSLDLLRREERSQSSRLTLAEAREKAQGLPGVVLEIDKPEDGPQSGLPLNLELRGEDFATLGDIAARIRAAITDVPGLVSLDDDFESSRPEIVITPDRTEASRLGLTTAEVAGTLRTAVHGTEASTFRRADEEIDITVRLQEGARRSLADLRQLAVVTESGVQVPLASVAEIELANSLKSIRHVDRKRTVTITGGVTEPRLAEPVRQEVRRRLEAMPDLLPPGYSYEFTGQQTEEKEASDFLRKAFLYGLVIVLGLIVAQFDSLAIPLIIMTSVVMSMIGVLIGLLVSGLPFGIVMTGVGVISLAGVVVNNAIVLLDYGEQLHARGIARQELVVLTGLRRLRPVMLTAVTTILGLIPLTTGLDFDFRTLVFSTNSESSQYWRSMGVAVIFGLGFGTFLTLVLVPVLYDLLLDLRERRQRRRAASGAPDPAPPSADRAGADAR